MLIQWRVKKKNIDNVCAYFHFDLFGNILITAKLGDTKELEDFIADLDKTLASKCSVLWEGQLL